MSSAKRWGAGLAAVALSVASLTACSSSGGPDGQSGQTSGGSGSGDSAQPLSLWVRAANEAKTQNLADIWNADHSPKIKVTAFPDDQFVTRVSTALASNELPDLLASDSAYMPQFLETNLFVDLTERVNSLEFADELFEPLMDVSTKEGKIYAVPRDPGDSMLLYNKDIYREAGLDPEKAPTTWAEITDHARQISDRVGGVDGLYFSGNCIGCIDFPGVPLAWATGGDIFDVEGNPTFNDPSVVEWLELYASWVEEGLVPTSAQTDTGTDWMTAFVAGKVGILPGGSFMLQTVREGNPEMDLGVAFLPGKDGGASTWIGGDVLGITEKAKDVDAAWEFVAWTLSEEVQVDVVAKSSELVARADLVENQYSKNDPAVLTSNEALAIGKTPQSKYFQQLVNDPNGPLATMFYSVLWEGADAQTAANEAQQKAESIVEQLG